MTTQAPGMVREERAGGLAGRRSCVAEVHKLYACHDRLMAHKQAVFEHLVGRWPTCSTSPVPTVRSLRSRPMSKVSLKRPKRVDGYIACLLAISGNLGPLTVGTNQSHLRAVRQGPLSRSVRCSHSEKTATDRLTAAVAGKAAADRAARLDTDIAEVRKRLEKAPPVQPPIRLPLLSRACSACRCPTPPIGATCFLPWCSNC